MMQKSKSSKWMCSKALYVLPVATLALSAFATVSPSRSAAILEGEVSTLTLNGQANARENVADSVLSLKNATLYCDEPAVMPHFPGPEHELWSFIGRNVRYPKEARESGVQGRVIVRFLVEKDGTLSNIRVEDWMGRKDKDEATTLRQVMVTAASKDSTAVARERTPEEEAAYQAGVAAIKAEAMRVIKAMPKWEPGYLDKAKTQPCATTMAIPMQFRLN